MVFASLTSLALQWKTIARSFGYLFFGVGVIVLLLIIYAMVSRLAH